MRYAERKGLCVSRHRASTRSEGGANDQAANTADGALTLAIVPAVSWADDPPGLVTVRRKHSVEATIKRFEDAVTAVG